MSDVSPARATHRLFFALWPSVEKQQALAENFRDVVVTSGGRAMSPANLHVTLVFLGSVPEDAVSVVESIALNVSQAVCVAREPIELTFDRAEHWRKPQVICATATSTPTVATDLSDRLKSDLTAAGFTPDLKAFRAHVTLARKVRHVSSKHWRTPPVVLKFRDFSLVESRTLPSGSSYSVRESWPLCAC